MNKASETQNKNIVTLVVDSVLRLWAFVTLVGVVTFVGATSRNGVPNSPNSPPETAI